MYFLLNLSHYVKSYGHLCQILVFFYHARPPNIAMSHDPRRKFRKKNYFFSNSAFNIRKSYKISSRKALYFRSYQPKTSWELEPPPPSAFRVKYARNICGNCECLSYKSWMAIPAKISANFDFWEEIHPNTPICDLYYSKEIISLF